MLLWRQRTRRRASGPVWLLSRNEVSIRVCLFGEGELGLRDPIKTERARHQPALPAEFLYTQLVHESGSSPEVGQAFHVPQRPPDRTPVPTVGALQNVDSQPAAG